MASKKKGRDKKVFKAEQKQGRREMERLKIDAESQSDVDEEKALLGEAIKLAKPRRKRWMMCQLKERRMDIFMGMSQSQRLLKISPEPKHFCRINSMRFIMDNC